MTTHPDEVLSDYKAQVAGLLIELELYKEMLVISINKNRLLAEELDRAQWEAKRLNDGDR